MSRPCLPAASSACSSEKLVRPSWTTTTSPSMMTSPGMASAPVISVKRLVQSRPFRVKTCFLPRLRWTWIRYPSYLIS
jgi:hypothetical protein